MDRRVVALVAVVAVLACGVAAYAYLSGRGGAQPAEHELASLLPTRDAARKLALEIREKAEAGYAVADAEYYLLSAAYYLKQGDREKAAEMLEKAKEALKSVQPVPAAPERHWYPVASNVGVSHPPTTWDFVPLGAVFTLTDKGYLAYPRGDQAWKLSCFIMVAVGKTEDGKVFAYQGRLPLCPEEGLFKPRVFVGGRWVVPNIVFAGPLYYDDGKRFGMPTVYEYDLSGKYLEYLSYDEKRRLWIHAIARVGGGPILRIEMRGLGAPMWLGEWTGGMLVHGVYAKAKNFDLWAGFWDVGPMNATLSVGGREVRAGGFMVFDRASHRVMQGDRGPRMGPPLAFSCMVIWQDDLAIMVTHSENPSPLDPGVGFEHQLRVNLYSLGVSLATTDFELRDDGGLQPSRFWITARLPNGYINITGRVYSYWPEKWVKGRGTWWNPDAYYAWGRAFTRWTGVVVVNGKVMRVDAWGVGEYTRYSPKPATTCRVGGKCGCWGG